MFTEIKMINYARPLKERRDMRRYCGPYTWRPSTPGKGRGFYQASKGELAVGDSTFSLRLKWANDCLADHGYGSLSRINGYYADRFQDTTLKPIIALLPHARGFLAGWTMGKGMCASLDADIWETEAEAARAAHDMADSDAEREREREEDEDEDEDA